VKPVTWLARPLALAGKNVLLAYLLSEMFPSVLDAVHLGDWYGGLASGSLLAAVGRSAACRVLTSLATVGLNRIGFRLRL
jgi:hypothetical protein